MMHQEATLSIISVLNDVPLAKFTSVCCSDSPVVEKKNRFLFEGIENGSVDYLLIKETHLKQPGGKRMK